MYAHNLQETSTGLRYSRSLVGGWEGGMGLKANPILHRLKQSLE